MNPRLIEAPTVFPAQPEMDVSPSPSCASISRSTGVNSVVVFRSLQALPPIVAAVFFALHFVHLNADFPNHSPWMDWAKYTDEGWYGDAAIRQLQRGQWYLPGDFNPAVALPVWPLLEFAFFKMTGVSLAAARSLSVSVFGLILLTAYILIRRSQSLNRPSPNAHPIPVPPAAPKTALAPAAAVALLAASPFCYVFTRLAILEPLLILLGLLALLAASQAASRRLVPVLCLGLLLPSMVLTKTTAVFLLPSIAWMLWASCGYRPRRFLSIGIPSAAIAAALWSAYFVLLVRPRFLEDYRYLFTANAYTGMTPATAYSILVDAFEDGMWMGRLMYPLALAAVFLALLCRKRVFRNPLVPSLLFWIAGYAAFLAYHDNMQPRYYLVIAVPLTLLLTVVAEDLIRILATRKAKGFSEPLPLVFTAVAAAAFLAIFLPDAVQTLHYSLTPQYTFAQAARELRGVVLADRGHSPLILSISGSDLSLMTGLPSICDDFGTMSLEDRAATYHPGWYATWNEVEDDKMEALAPLFHLQRVAAFPALDDPERNLLILYRLDPPIAPAPERKHRRPVPKLLQTRIGQQPSATQLEH